MPAYNRRKMQIIADFRLVSPTLNNSWLKGHDWALWSVFYTSQVTVLPHVLTNCESHCKNVICRDRFSSIMSYRRLTSYCVLLLHESYFCPFYSLLYKSSYSSSIRRKMQNIADFRRFSSSLNNSWLKGNDWAITILQHVLTNLKSHYKNVIFRDRISSILPNTSQDAPNYFVYFFFTFLMNLPLAYKSSSSSLSPTSLWW